MAATGITAIVERDYRIARSYRLALLLDVTYGLIHLAVFFFIAETLEDPPSAELHGAPTYFAFAAVGIVVATVVDAATSGIASRVREEQLTGTLEALAAQPLGAAELSVGLVGFPFLFAVVRGTFYLVIAGFWMDLDLAQTNWVGLAVMLLTTGAALAGIGVVAGAVALVLKRGQVFAAGVIFALTLLSGSVFPITVLPDWIQWLAEIVPIRFAFDGTRAALFAGEGWADDSLLLALFGIVAIPAAVWIFARALDYARREGSLAEY
jgi:ABC-2 type transport system permease protein